MEQSANCCINARPKQVVRPLAYYHSNVWADHFLNYSPPDELMQRQREEEVNELKEVRRKLLGNAENTKERLVLLDVIEQLGVAYHFEDEIEANLQHFFNNYSNDDAFYEEDLHFVSLRFRLLRQHGFYASADVFNMFKNEDGSFKELLTKDVVGMLNLYETSHLRVHGEEVLDEAVEFTTSQLKSVVGELSEPLATQVNQALILPLYRGVSRLLSRHYISAYEASPSHDQMLLKFAKLDFNLLQTLYLTELQDLSRWWRDLDFNTKLPFIRDRITEAYFWVMGAFYEPQYAWVRKISTKLFKMLSIMDDTYDAYGLFEELIVYTEAVQRWDKSNMNQLPDYMKLTYENLLDTFDEIRNDLAKEGRSHLVSYVQELMKALCRGYFQEAKWCKEKHVPTYDEYLNEAALATAGHAFLSGAFFLGMGELATEAAFEWLCQTPKHIQVTNIIVRLLDDIASYKNEQKRDHVASVVQCCMKQYDLTEEEAVTKLRNIMEEKWIILNREMLRPTMFPRLLITRILDLLRATQAIYFFGEDEYTIVNQNMQHKIQLVLIQPIIV